MALDLERRVRRRDKMLIQIMQTLFKGFIPILLSKLKTSCLALDRFPSLLYHTLDAVISNTSDTAQLGNSMKMVKCVSDLHLIQVGVHRGISIFSFQASSSVAIASSLLHSMQVGFVVRRAWNLIR